MTDLEGCIRFWEAMLLNNRFVMGVSVITQVELTIKFLKELKEKKMTKEEILVMEAGRELDIAVGREVMGLDVGMVTAADYSADISAAWEVLKKLREEYWCIEIKIADGCWVIMELLQTPPIRVEVNAGTPFERLPEAICKAALLTKLEDKPCKKK